MKNNKKSSGNKTKKIGSNLTLLLKHHSLSYRKLSKAVGVVHTHIFRLSKAKYDNPGFMAVDKLAKFFKISVVQLMGEQKIDFKKLPKDRNPDKE